MKEIVLLLTGVICLSIAAYITSHEKGPVVSNACNAPAKVGDKTEQALVLKDGAPWLQCAYFTHN